MMAGKAHRSTKFWFGGRYADKDIRMMMMPKHDHKRLLNCIKWKIEWKTMENIILMKKKSSKKHKKERIEAEKARNWATNVLQ